MASRTGWRRRPVLRPASEDHVGLPTTRLETPQTDAPILEPALERLPAVCRSWRHDLTHRRQGSIQDITTLVEEWEDHTTEWLRQRPSSVHHARQGSPNTSASPAPPPGRRQLPGRRQPQGRPRAFDMIGEVHQRLPPEPRIHSSDPPTSTASDAGRHSDVMLQEGMEEARLE